jgi:hypothetical protein
MDPTQGYYYIAYWDSRYPANAANPAVKNSSWLRFYTINGTEYTQAQLGGLSSFKINPENMGTFGFLARTTSNNYVSAPADNHNGALEVRMVNIPTTASFEDCHWNFVIKA